MSTSVRARAGPALRRKKEHTGDDSFVIYRLGMEIIWSYIKTKLCMFKIIDIECT